MLKWAILVFSSLFEIGWVAGLKYAASPAEWALTIICVIGSSIFLVLATKMLSTSIAYISFVVFGTIGTYIVDVLFFDKKINIISILAIIVMLYCIYKLNRSR